MCLKDRLNAVGRRWKHQGQPLGGWKPLGHGSAVPLRWGVGWGGVTAGAGKGKVTSSRRAGGAGPPGEKPGLNMQR